MQKQKTEQPGRILLAPDSFKETLANIEVVEAMAEACQRLWPKCELDHCPMADGGEGTLHALQAPWGLSRRSCVVRGPLQDQSRVSAQWAQGAADSGRGVVELAEAAGLGLVDPAARDPESASTHGVGMLMMEAIGKNVRELILATGGSSTVDGGVGALGAIGVLFRDQHGARVEQPISASALQSIVSMEVPDSVRNQWKSIRLRIAADVMNPLLGENGAARIYGPQKGATPEAVERLDHGLTMWARLLGGNPSEVGAGSAGGVPFGMAAILGGSIERGVEVVLDAVNFDERCRNADLVLTGEGSLDATSRMGKVAVAVAECAGKYDVPVIAVVGSRCENFGSDAPFQQVVSLVDHFSKEEAMHKPSMAIQKSMLASLV